MSEVLSCMTVRLSAAAPHSAHKGPLRDEHQQKDQQDDQHQGGADRSEARPQKAAERAADQSAAGPVRIQFLRSAGRFSALEQVDERRQREVDQERGRDLDDSRSASLGPERIDQHSRKEERENISQHPEKSRLQAAEKASHRAAEAEIAQEQEKCQRKKADDGGFLAEERVLFLPLSGG